MDNNSVQLKVCEGCGALYLRETAERNGAFCPGCKRRLSAFPAAGKRQRPKWKPRPRPSAVLTPAVAGGAR